jgi:hypothetical protein
MKKPNLENVLANALNALPDGGAKKDESVINLHADPRWLPALRVVLAGVYRIGVAGGGIALVYVGGSPWLLLLVLPFLAFGPSAK